MRAPLDTERLKAFLAALGKEANGGRLYLTGGATAILEGWRASTIDVDLRVEPDDDAVMRALPELKERLDVHHFDPYSQALAKIERGFDHDLEDVREMIARGLVEPRVALALFAQIAPALYRCPAIDPDDFARRVHEVLGSP